MYTILRLMEYTYATAEEADADMQLWQIPPIGARRIGGERVIRSTILQRPEPSEGE